MPLRLPPKRCMQLQGMDTRRIADGGDSVLRADRRPVGWDEGWPVERSPRENLRIRRRQLAAGPRLLDEVTLCACMVKGGEIGDFGGGSLEPSRRWRGAPWLGLALGVPSCPEPPAAP